MHIFFIPVLEKYMKLAIIRRRPPDRKLRAVPLHIMIIYVTPLAKSLLSGTHNSSSLAPQCDTWLRSYGIAFDEYPNTPQNRPIRYTTQTSKITTNSAAATPYLNTFSNLSLTWYFSFYILGRDRNGGMCTTEGEGEA